MVLAFGGKIEVVWLRLAEFLARGVLMITIFKTTEAGLEQVEDVVAGSWVNVVDPTTDEIERLRNLGVPQDFITYPLDIDEQPRTEKEDDGTLLVLIRIPFYQGEKSDIPYTTIPLGVILKENYTITVTRWQNPLIQDFSSGRVRGFSTGKRYRFLLRVLLSTANRFLAHVREINRAVDILEDQLQQSIRNKEVLELLKYQKSLVYFTTALKSNELMLERLQRTQIFRMYPDDEDLLEDVITENQQAIEMTNISSNILTSMMDAFASIISNNLNEVMKFLASVTIVLSIPTIITSYFGMNVGLPLQNNPLAYVYIIAIFVAIAALVVYIFMKRNWF
jgi:magnesium transporter